MPLNGNGPTGQTKPVPDNSLDPKSLAINSGAERTPYAGKIDTV
jgi:hypothetical protein|tara:strand:- start:53 stop:184 length:132 start_codon:yes stop_codon:yes gene_type:complete